ncbi:MAG: GNAT family N-acetyltransferase [Gammaproteobacteria bacterium]|nr:GNAT family N-acetyltransferase [Gammaproteobacteria bacterium]
MNLARPNAALRRVLDGRGPLVAAGPAARSEPGMALDPAMLAESWHLASGSQIDLRAIAPGDRVALREDLFFKLGADSLRNRFFCTKLDLSEDELTRFCQVDFLRHVAIVAESRVGDSRRLIGVGRFVRACAASTWAEVAITVQDDYQGRGIGGLLLHKLTDCARNLGIERLEGSMLAQNFRMAKLMRGLRLPCASRLENGISTLSLDLCKAPAPEPLAQFRRVPPMRIPPSIAPPPD